MSITDKQTSIGCYITPHGLGHAARACAVMATLQERCPAVHFKLFTQVPEWFFQESGINSFSYTPLKTDVGLVQDSPMYENLTESVEQLNEHLPYRLGILDELAQMVTDCEFVICDVSTMGIAVAEVAGIPSVLIENFTWDWVYNQYASRASGMRRHAAYLRSMRQRASVLIQATPVCEKRQCRLTANPVSRKTRQSRETTRRELGIIPGQQLVLITTGGIVGDFPFLEKLKHFENIQFLIPGASQEWTREDNLILCPMNSGLHHPDIINAADAVVCKAGYSTIAEAYRAGVPVGYIIRETFPESPVLASFIPQHMKGIEITCNEWNSGSWTHRIPALLELPRIQRADPNGADQIADFLTKKFRI